MTDKNENARVADPGETFEVAGDDSRGSDHSTILAEALRAHSLGLDVMPLPPRSKAPTATGWPKRRPYDPDELSAHWARQPNANYGVRCGRLIGACGDYLAVVDIDAIDDAALTEALAAAQEWLGDWSTCPMVRSGGGIGFHLYYRTRQPVKSCVPRESRDLVTLPNGKKKRRWKLELKGAGTQVVGPGSVHPDTGATYAWAREIAPADAPMLPELPASWTQEGEGPPIDLPPAPAPAAPIEGNLGGIGDRLAEQRRTDDLKRLRAALEACAAAVASTPEGERNVTLNSRTAYAAGVHIGGLHLHPGEVSARMAAAGIAAGLDADAVRATVRSAVEFGRGSPIELVDRPRDADPPGDTIRQKVDGDRPEEWLQQADDAAENIGDPDWLIRGWLEVGQTAVLFGQSGHGKSFVLADILSSIASGRAWCGHPVKQGPVVALVGEGRRGFLRRLKAWKQHHDVTDRLPIYVSPAPVTLNVEESSRKVAAAIATVTKREGRPPVLVSCDTLRTHLKGDDNQSEDTAAFFAGFRTAVADTGAAALTVHHSGNEGTRERGSSNIRAECDLSAQATKDGAVITVKAVKVRDGEEPPALTLRMHTEELGKDAEGKPVTAGVAVHDADAEPAESAPKGKADRTPREWQSLHQAFMASGELHPRVGDDSGDLFPYVSRSALREYFLQHVPDKSGAPKSPNAATKAATRCVEALTKAGWIREQLHGYIVVKQGAADALRLYHAHRNKPDGGSRHAK